MTCPSLEQIDKSWHRHMVFEDTCPLVGPFCACYFAALERVLLQFQLESVPTLNQCGGPFPYDMCNVKSEYISSIPSIDIF